MGFSKSSIDGLVKKVSLKNMMLKLNEILLQIVSLKRRKRMLTLIKITHFNKLKKNRSQRTTYILLHGVTGSGKTEVYLQAIEEVLKMNKP